MKNKILLIEDELDLVEVTKMRLKKSGYEIISALSGEEAFTFLQKDIPDLVLLDIAMPGMDGYSAAADMKKDKATADIPIIFLTAKELDPQSIDKRTGEFGVCDFIMKPCSFDDLAKKITNLIG